MKEGFLQAIREEYPNEEVTRLVFADWCAENEPELEEKLRRRFLIVDNLTNYLNYGSDCGYGDGYGFGFGYGDGNGSYENGIGNGNGYNFFMNALGFGNGDGFAHFSNDCFGTNYNNPILKMPKLNTNQLVFLPFGWIFCGHVAEHIQPYQFKLTDASLFLEPPAWENFGDYPSLENIGKISDFRKFGTITIGPQFLHSIDWIGDLP